MGRLPVDEPAEEVRLAAQELIQAVVKTADARYMLYAAALCDY